MGVLPPSVSSVHYICVQCQWNPEAVDPLGLELQRARATTGVLGI